MADYIAYPFDTVFFRGNKSFDFGEWYSEGFFPPLPSTFQGFVRSCYLKHQNLLSDGLINDNDSAVEQIGDDSTFPKEITGPFVCDAAPYFVTPKDIIIADTKGCKPVTISDKSYLTDLGFKLNIENESGKKQWLHDEQQLVSMDHLNAYRHADIFAVPTYKPNHIENHIGISLDLNNTVTGPVKNAQEGLFYLTPYNRMNKDTGFYFKFDYDSLEEFGKLGSEGRGARITSASLSLNLKMDNSFYEDLAKSKRFKLICLQPGLFENGWIPFDNEIIDGNLVCNYNGFRFKLLYAAVEKKKIGGYSLRKKAASDESQPGAGLKNMKNAVAYGSIYHFEFLDLELNDNEQLKTAQTFLHDLDDTKIPNGIYSKMGFNHICLGKSA